MRWPPPFVTVFTEKTMSDTSLPDWIIEQMSDALIYINHEGMVERWNQAACTLFGY